MTSVRAACIQPNTGTDWEANLAANRPRIEDAAKDGAIFVQTPEVTNFIFRRRRDTMEAARLEEDDPSLAAYRDLAAKLGVWLNIGSLALKTAGDDRLVNRSFLIAPDGAIANRYEKIHMFDVDLPSGESFKESKAYRPGASVNVVDLPFGRLGMTICYDMRFPHLYRDLAKAGADILTMPSAFTAETGKAHWHVLLRARAIENGCFVIAAAQTGEHDGGRQTYGHSLIVAPWGEVLADAGEEPGWVAADLDMEKIEKARRAVPSLSNDRPYDLGRTAATQAAE
ncbi:carbon-nitrogen hydrolase family protein [Minwuia thermotolerans]|uniref:Amidohydrolase n=1 Tax=Minwuia thermotolerans TaxID=2056226 RepID=A0A2M9G6M8_9PROT|nr:carbon-nitrogen hydrolase family protein [Minwuia thermotolerans]PJK31361.1 amidohydrolase [Minwuia thermotolerans]